jgi:hypothetical protein
MIPPANVLGRNGKIKKGCAVPAQNLKRSMHPGIVPCTVQGG